MDWLRRYTDGICAQLRLASIDEQDAVELLLSARATVLRRFPGKESQYTRIYERRFRRILARRGIYLPLNNEDFKGN